MPVGFEEMQQENRTNSHSPVCSIPPCTDVGKVYNKGVIHKMFFGELRPKDKWTQRFSFCKYFVFSPKRGKTYRVSNVI